VAKLLNVTGCNLYKTLKFFFMKQVLNSMTLKTSFSLFVALLIQTVLLAQDGGGASNSSGSVSVTRTETTSSNWYASPWVWVIGVAVFILLLVALLRGGSDKSTTTSGRTDRVTVTKTSSSEI
jgi:hypothetical protein